MKALYAFFIFACLTFFTIIALQYLQIAYPKWIQFYVNDFLCMPVVLTICLSVVHFIKKDYSIRLSLFTVLSLAAIYSVYFEGYLPEEKERYTADILDVVMYFSGSLLFYFLQFKK